MVVIVEMHDRASLRVLWRCHRLFDFALRGGYFPVAERNVMESQRKENLKLPFGGAQGADEKRVASREIEQITTNQTE